MTVASFFNEFQGLISSILGISTLIVAIIALNTWKQELKAKKLYELHYKAYKQLDNLKIELHNLKEFYKDFGESINDDCFNNQISKFFIKNLDEINELALNLSQINEKNKTIEYFSKIYRDYSLKSSDLNYGQMQTRYISETGEVEEYDPFYKNFTEDYFQENDNEKFDDFHNEINSKIEAGLKYFDEKIKKFFK